MNTCKRWKRLDFSQERWWDDSGKEEGITAQQYEILLHRFAFLNGFVIDGDTSNAAFGIGANQDHFVDFGETVGATGESDGISHRKKLSRGVNAGLDDVAADGDFVGVDFGDGDGNDSAGIFDILSEGFSDFFFQFGRSEVDGTHISEQGHGDGAIGSNFDIGVEFWVFPYANAESVGYPDDVFASSWIGFSFVGEIGRRRAASRQRCDQGCKNE